MKVSNQILKDSHKFDFHRGYLIKTCRAIKMQCKEHWNSLKNMNAFAMILNRKQSTANR